MTQYDLSCLRVYHRAMEAITLAEAVHGSYSHTRFRGQLPDVKLQIKGCYLTKGKSNTTNDCGIYHSATAAAATGQGFPPELTNIVIIGVSGAIEGVSLLPELHFEATRAGRRILCKAVSRELLALEVVSCNDLGTGAALAARISSLHRPVYVTFTDVRYTLARTGTDMPIEPARRFVRRLSDNAARSSRTTAEAVQKVRDSAALYAKDIPNPDLMELTERAIARAQTRAPGKRDRSKEIPQRTPARQVRLRRKSTERRWGEI